MPCVRSVTDADRQRKEADMGLLRFFKTLFNRQNTDWETLHLAINKGSYEVVESLLNMGVSPNARNPHKQTALLGAVVRCNAPIVELLLSKGANVNQPDVYGITPLGMAARKGKRNLLELLLSHGADVDGRDGTVGGPLIIATEEGFYELVELLLSKNADVNACPERDRRTALHTAAYKGHNDIARLLLRRGANVHVVDKDGKAPIDYAAQRGNSEIVSMLKAATS